LDRRDKWDPEDHPDQLEFPAHKDIMGHLDNLAKLDHPDLLVHLGDLADQEKMVATGAPVPMENPAQLDKVDHKVVVDSPARLAHPDIKVIAASREYLVLLERMGYPVTLDHKVSKVERAQPEWTDLRDNKGHEEVQVNQEVAAKLVPTVFQVELVQMDLLVLQDHLDFPVIPAQRVSQVNLATKVRKDHKVQEEKTEDLARLDRREKLVYPVLMEHPVQKVQQEMLVLLEVPVVLDHVVPQVHKAILDHPVSKDAKAFQEQLVSREITVQRVLLAHKV
jgi:hypothetical protein